MKLQKLGTEGLEVSALGLGCMGMTWAYAGGSEAGAIATIQRALGTEPNGPFVRVVAQPRPWLSVVGC
jgi:hypothetical protein